MWEGGGAGTIRAQTSITFLYFLKCLTCEELIRIRHTCKELVRKPHRNEESVLNLHTSFISSYLI